MVARYILFHVLVLTAGYAHGQETVDRKFLGSGFNGFTIPNNPASKVIGAESSNLMLPSPAFFPIAASVVVASNGTSYSVEGTPFYKNIKERRYDDFSDISNNFKVSFAYTNNNRSTGAVSVGIRTSITANRSYFYLEALNFHKREQADIEKLQLEFARRIRMPLYLIFADSLRSIQLDNFVEEKLAAANARARRDIISDHWNRLILDLGAAILIAGEQDPMALSYATPGDSTSSTLGVRRFSFWYNGAVPISNKTQYAFTIGYSRNLFMGAQNITSVAARFNHGTNFCKGYGEVGFRGGLKKDSMMTLGWLIGAEMNVFEGIWIDVNVGLSGTGTNRDPGPLTRMTSALTLRITPQQILLDNDD